MDGNGFKYDRMVERALRGVVREALREAAANGLPGNHHFYISFRTDHADVSIAPYLHERYPDEMTIVLQHQFWGLEVDEDGFEVTLSFNDKPERLVIPLQSITAFADPSVRFGLQFEGEGSTVEEFDTSDREGYPDGDEESPDGGGQVAHLPDESDDDKAVRGSDDKNEEKTGDASAEVITLDSFRKK